MTKQRRQTKKKGGHRAADPEEPFWWDFWQRRSALEKGLDDPSTEIAKQKGKTELRTQLENMNALANLAAPAHLKNKLVTLQRWHSDAPPDQLGPWIRGEDSNLPLPQSIRQDTLAKIQAAYDELMGKYGKAPRDRIAKLAKVAQSTVQLYMPYLKR